MTRIEFVIDELVLVGFSPGDRHRIADAVARELATLGADAQHALRQAVMSGGSASALRAPDVSMSHTHPGDAPSGHAIGTGVGRAIASAIANTGGDAARG